jgi:hypothetical protein
MAERVSWIGAIAVILGLAAPMATSTALLSDVEAASATLSSGADFGGVVYRLHNNPTPPSGDTNAQANLTMTVAMSTTEPLHNYDVDFDAAAGRSIATGGSGATEADLAQYQNWRGPANGVVPTVINGTVTVRLWTALRDFAPGAGELRVFLRVFRPILGYAELGNATISDADWQAGSPTWIRASVGIAVSTTLLSGYQLEVKVIVGSGSSDAMWLAYDTVSYPSDVRLP